MTGAAKGTVLKLLVDTGSACAEYHDKHVLNITSKNIQCDEIWSFCYAKQANVPEAHKGVFGFGDVYTWTALDADTKLIVSYLVDRRDEKAAHNFTHDLAKRLSNRVQLTTDGHPAYLRAIEDAFGIDIDYAMLIKIYSNHHHWKEDSRRYSPGKFCSTRKEKITGRPLLRNASTSHVERQNLTMRMSMRRLTRLTNAFSKKVENHAHSVALHFMYYNFCRIHQTLRVTPAMEAGISDHVWSLEEIAGLIK
jgi:IS1 family transposase